VVGTATAMALDARTPDRHLRRGHLGAYGMPRRASTGTSVSSPVSTRPSVRDVRERRPHALSLSTDSARLRRCDRCGVILPNVSPIYRKRR
jgi:hypothetical protein